jgi:hypothetical protein
MDISHARLHEPQGSSDAHASTRHDLHDKASDHGLPENHVRLVRILPGYTDELVLCEIRIFSFPISSGYTAISYAWGPPVAEHAVVLDGRRHLVPKNLWHFLTTWRSFRGKRVLSEPAALDPHPQEELSSSKQDPYRMLRYS